MPPKRKPVVIKRSGGALDKRNVYDLPHVAKYKQDIEVHYPNEEILRLQIPRHFQFVGTTGSGKTSELMRLMFNNIGVFTRVYLIAGDLTEQLYESLVNEPLEWTPGLSVVASDSLDAWPLLFAEIKKEVEMDPASKGEAKLLIVDDQIEKKIPNALLEAFNQGRKYNLTCCWVGSSAVDVPLKIRNNIKYRLIFCQQSDRVARRLFQQAEVDVDEAMKLYHKAINTDNGGEGFVLVDGTPKSIGTPWQVRHGYKPVDLKRMEELVESDSGTDSDHSPAPSRRRPAPAKKAAEGRALLKKA